MKNLQKYLLILSAFFTPLVPLQCSSTTPVTTGPGPTSTGPGPTSTGPSSRSATPVQTKLDIKSLKFDVLAEKDDEHGVAKILDDKYVKISVDDDDSTYGKVLEFLFDIPRTKVPSRSVCEKSSKALVSNFGKKIMASLALNEKVVPLSDKEKKSSYGAWKLNKDIIGHEAIPIEPIMYLIAYHDIKPFKNNNNKDDDNKPIWKKASTYGIATLGLVAGVAISFGVQYFSKDNEE